jgi:hypothetical protein
VALDALLENVHLPFVPRILRARRPDKLVGRLIAGLEHDQPVVRAGAADLLGESGDARAAVPLLLAFKREAACDPLPFIEGTVDVRQRVGDALQKLGAVAFESYIAALSDEDPQLRACAARALTILADPRAADALLAALEKDRAALRQGNFSGASQPLLAIAEALGTMNDPRAIDALSACLSDAMLRSGLAIDEHQPGSWWHAFAEAASTALSRLGAPRASNID